MPRCRRCGTEFVRQTISQERCPQCAREVAALTAPRPAPQFTPAWRKRDLSRDETALVLR